MPTTVDPTEVPAVASASESATSIDSVTARWSKILPFNHPCDGTTPHPTRRSRPFSRMHTTRRVLLLPTSSPAAIIGFPGMNLGFLLSGRDAVVQSQIEQSNLWRTL